MEHFAEVFLRIKNFLKRYGFPLFSVAYLLIAFKLLPDYGLGFDSPKNFDEGWINLNYLLTGHASLKDQFALPFQIHGALFFMIADLMKRLLSDGLGWLDPVSARHSFLPLLVFIFMNLCYRFLKIRAGAKTAFLTCAILLTFPAFFGNAFMNIKDIPLFVCFSLAIFSFYEWHHSGFQRSRYLYGAILSLGLALLSKLYAVLLPVILTLWLIVLELRSSHPKNHSETEVPALKGLWTRKNIFHGLAGSSLALVLIALFFMPAFYSVEEKMIFFEMRGRVVKSLMEHGTQGWSFYPWIQILYVTPVLTLVMAILGLTKMLLEKPLTSLSALMLVWFFVVISIACTPLFPVYNGIRLFMVFLVPFCFFVATGINCTAELIGRTHVLRQSWVAWSLGITVIVLQIIGITVTHPYETTFFNCLAGGLKGAQEKHIPDAGDYWLTSYGEAVRWINQNAPAGAFLWVPSMDDHLLVKYYFMRDDLYRNYIKQTPLPGQSFLIINPGETCWANVTPDIRKAIEQESRQMVKVHEIRRQGGELLTIYYKP